MRILAVIFGIVLILLVAQDAFETIVLPRRVSRRIRLARLFYRTIQAGWRSLGQVLRPSAGRETFLGYLGPLSLLAALPSGASVQYNTDYGGGPIPGQADCRISPAAALRLFRPRRETSRPHGVCATKGHKRAPRRVRAHPFESPVREVWSRRWIVRLRIER